MSQTRDAGPISRQCQHLRANGVRCHIRSLPSPSGRGVSGGMVSLRVHKDDLDRAHRLLRQLGD